MRGVAIVIAVVLAAAPTTKCSTDTGTTRAPSKTVATCDEPQTWCKGRK